MKCKNRFFSDHEYIWPRADVIVGEEKISWQDLDLEIRNNRIENRPRLSEEMKVAFWQETKAAFWQEPIIYHTKSVEHLIKKSAKHD